MGLNRRQVSRHRSLCLPRRTDKGDNMWGIAIFGLLMLPELVLVGAVVIGVLKQRHEKRMQSEAETTRP